MRASSAMQHRRGVARRVLRRAEHRQVGVCRCRMALRLPNIPVTRVENLCATGTEALRGAVYAVAAGACDIALAHGRGEAEGHRLRRPAGAHQGHLRGPVPARQHRARRLRAARQRLRAPSTATRMDELQARRWRTSPVKSHENGARNPKAHLRNRITDEQVLAAPTIADPLGLYDCCGVSDGAACAIVTTPEMRAQLGKRDLVTIKALQLAPSNGVEMSHQSWDGSYTLTTPLAAQARLRRGRHQRPAQGDRPDRGARLLLDHRARDDGGPGLLRRGRRLARHARRPLRRATARFPARSTAASSASATRSAPPACAWPTRSTCSCSAAPASASCQRRPSGLTHNLGGIPNRNVASVAIFGVAS